MSSTDCGSEASHVPWILFVIGFCVQMLNQGFIVFNKNKTYGSFDSLDEFDASINAISKVDCSGRCCSRILRTLRFTLLIYSIVMFGYQLVYDFSDINHHASNLDSTWDRYQCYSRIMLNSPNFKSCLSAISVGGFRAIGNLPTICDLIGSYQFILTISLLLWIPICITHVLPGFILYLWVLLVAGIGICCLLIFPSLWVGEKYEHFNPNRHNTYGGGLAFCVMCYIPAVVILCLCGIYLGLTFSNYADGIGYIDAIAVTWDSRNFDGYIDHYEQTVHQVITLIWTLT